MKLRAYIVGLALGDGNLSNPNGRAVKLRLTCDKKYPNLIKCSKESLKLLFPDNKIGVVNRGSCVDVYCYSNYLENILGWKAKEGSKIKQKVCIPNWIKSKSILLVQCLRGLLQTDGSIYNDRGYEMVNFVNHGQVLAEDVYKALKMLGYSPNLQVIKITNKSFKYTVRVSRDSGRLIKHLGLIKN